MKILKELLIVILCCLLGGGIPYVVGTNLPDNMDGGVFLLWIIMVVTHSIAMGKLIGNTFH